ncbi:MAG: FKBP-type peptidyl-prolyl cis-trans isomerase [Candidatus Micrarchaeia archaeon]
MRTPLAIAAIALALLLLGCPQARRAKAGDTVVVDYTLRLANGSFIDASNASAAQALGIFDPERLYQPVRTRIGSGGLIVGFEDALVGMAEGESKEVAVPPERAYGEWRPELVRRIPREYNLSRTDTIDLPVFLAKYGNRSAGDVILLPNWNATVLEVSDTGVAIRHNPRLNQLIPFEPFPQRVVFIGDDYITMRHEAAVGDVGKFLNASGLTKLRVIAADEQFLTVDANHELAGQTLVFNITLLKIE